MSSADETEMEDLGSGEVTFSSTREDVGERDGWYRAGGLGGFGESVEVDCTVLVSGGDVGVVLRYGDGGDGTGVFGCRRKR